MLWRSETPHDAAGWARRNIPVSIGGSVGPVFGCTLWSGSCPACGKDLLGPLRHCADPVVDQIIIRSGTEDMTKDELIEAH